MNQADENISLRERIAHLPQVYLKKEKKNPKKPWVTFTHCSSTESSASSKLVLA